MQLLNWLYAIFSQFKPFNFFSPTSAIVLEFIWRTPKLISNHKLLEDSNQVLSYFFAKKNAEVNAQVLIALIKKQVAALKNFHNLMICFIFSFTKKSFTKPNFLSQNRDSIKVMAKRSITLLLSNSTNLLFHI